MMKNEGASMRYVLMCMVVMVALSGCSGKEIKQRTGEIANDIKGVFKGRE